MTGDFACPPTLNNEVRRGLRIWDSSFHVQSNEGGSEMQSRQRNAILFEHIHPLTFEREQHYNLVSTVNTMLRGGAILPISST